MNNRSRHAYLIIAHSHPEIFKCLISALEDERNDIFCHIDKKANIDDFKKVIGGGQNVSFVNERVDVRWGDISQIEAEMTLLKAALNNGDYGFYHLISGVDMPVKSQDDIHRFFDERKEFNFIGYVDDYWRERLKHRCDVYSFFLKYQRHRFFGKIVKGLNRFVFEKVQKLLGVKRTYPFEIMLGSNWFSINNQLCKFIVQNYKYYYSQLHHITCVDEIFLQTVAWDSPYRQTLYNYGGKQQEMNMRLIDWQRGNPYSFQIEDLNELFNSNKMFCRKVESEHLAKVILKKLKQKT